MPPERLRSPYEATSICDRYLILPANVNAATGLPGRSQALAFVQAGCLVRAAGFCRLILLGEALPVTLFHPVLVRPWSSDELVPSRDWRGPRCFMDRRGGPVGPVPARFVFLWRMKGSEFYWPAVVPLIAPVCSTAFVEQPQAAGQVRTRDWCRRAAGSRRGTGASRTYRHHSNGPGGTPETPASIGADRN